MTGQELPLHKMLPRPAGSGSANAVPCQLPEGSSEAKGQAPSVALAIRSLFHIMPVRWDVPLAQTPVLQQQVPQDSFFLTVHGLMPTQHPLCGSGGKNSSALQSNAKAIEGNMQKHSLELV